MTGSWVARLSLPILNPKQMPIHSTVKAQGSWVCVKCKTMVSNQYEPFMDTKTSKQVKAIYGSCKCHAQKGAVLVVWLPAWKAK